MGLLVIEGLDGGGKSTQTRLLIEALEKMGENFLQVKFPDYDSASSSLVKMYLAGEFGGSPKSVNPYAASTFYAVDRFASFQTKWQADYEAGRLIVADRYATSNLIYQLGKLPRDEWDSYIEWMEDLEYGKLKLPRPSKVIFLDMPIDVSQKLLSKRYEGDESKKDIHEADIAFLEESYQSAIYSAKRLGWEMIQCAENGEPRSIEDIHKDIMVSVKAVL